MTVGERFRELRKERGIPAAVLARRVGVSTQTLWLLERWDLPPRSHRVRQALARELRVPYETLWDEVEGGESTP